MTKTMKLTPALLRKIVLEEKTRMMREAAKTSDPVASGKEHPSDVEAEEVDADGLAGTIAQDINYMKALKIQETKLANRLRRIQEAKRRIRARTAKRLG